jgi:hypothetical protein
MAPVNQFGRLCLCVAAAAAANDNYSAWAFSQLSRTSFDVGDDRVKRAPTAIEFFSF